VIVRAGTVADPTIPESAHLDCIHCGICLSACPTYLQLGIEVDSPRGRIYLIHAHKEGRVPASSEIFQEHLLLCLECRACETACPSGVHFSALMNDARAEIHHSQRLPMATRILKKLLMDWIFPSRPLMKFGFRLLRLYQRSGLRDRVRNSRILHWLPARIQAMEALLPDLPSPAHKRYESVEKSRGKVLFFEGCIMPEIFGPVHEATVRVLRRNGFDVEFPRRQSCCGALHLHDGDLEAARRLARKNILSFENAESLPIVVNSAGCGASLKEYGEWLAGDPQFASRARDFCRRVRDISDFMDTVGMDRNLGRLDLKVAYDDPCHLLHAQKIKSAPRNLLKSIPGLELVDLRDADRCCGSAGIYNLVHPDMSERILDDKIANILRSGAQVVATGNPGCMLQIQSGLRRKHLSIRVAHPVELLDQSYEKFGNGEA
jgi:Fe-S oxidoreductase